MLVRNKLKLKYITNTACLLGILVAICSCRTSEFSNKNSFFVRTDGFYIAKDNYSKAINNPDEMKVLENKNVFYLIRFYDSQFGVMIPDMIKGNINFSNDSIAKFYFEWCRKFELQNPIDKNYVNFRYKIENDSLKFEQRTEEFKYMYVGEIYEDSIVLHPSILYQNPDELRFKNDINRVFNFSFIPVK